MVSADLIVGDMQRVLDLRDRKAIDAEIVAGEQRGDADQQEDLLLPEIHAPPAGAAPGGSHRKRAGTIQPVAHFDPEYFSASSAPCRM